MSNFKAGDRFKVISDHLSFVDVNIGDIVVLSKIEGDNCHLFYHQKTKSHVDLFFHHVEIIDGSEYESSNRYKLKQAIKETGFSSRKLSHFASGNESFFYNQTGLARFKEYGDISWSKLDELIDLVDMAKERLNAKIMQDAFDEREKLDLGAKTVDENNVPVKKFKPEDVKITFGDTEIKGTLSEFDELFSKAEKDIDNSEQEDIKRFVDQLQSQAIEKRDSRLKNWLIVLIGFSLLLAFYFFQK